MRRRRFNESERLALYYATGGRCAWCGCLLADFHADHVEAYARGGATDVLNGQALCAACNLKKADRPMLKPWTSSVVLRTWQHEAVQRYEARDTGEFLLVATPGSGKTIAAGRIAHRLLSERKVERVVVISPSDTLRTQWATKFSRLGIEINPDWNFTIYLRGYVGVSATYQQVASKPYAFRLLTERPTLVILDEIHHASDDRSWGDALREAFGSEAVRKLSLSGTPFRSDNATIPFITYIESRSVPDYYYGYDKALRDGNIVRHVIFPSYDAHTEWMDATGIRSATFEDELGVVDASRRLNTAISLRGNWLREVITEANAQLLKMRQRGHPAAGGLVIARDTEHAERVARLVAEVSGTEPVLATSKDPNASNLIEAFGRGEDPWIVAVKMISEGVDIPRLRIGVYATNVTTDLFIRQAVGRVVRWQSELEEEQTAWFFFPKDPSLIASIRSIQEERNHVIEEAAEPIQEHPGDAQGDGAARITTFDPLKAEVTGKSTFLEGQDFSEEEERQAKMDQSRYGLWSVPWPMIAAMRRGIYEEMNPDTAADWPAQGSGRVDGSNSNKKPAPPSPRFLEEAQLRKEINSLAAIAAYHYDVEPKDIHLMAIKRFDKAQGEMTLEELQEKKQWLAMLIKDAKRYGNA